MEDRNLILHPTVVVGAGGALKDNRVIPIVTLSFVNDDTAIDDLEEGHYDPFDGRWDNFTLTVRGARQLLSDLGKCVEAAIQGPEGGISPADFQED